MNWYDPEEPEEDTNTGEEFDDLVNDQVGGDDDDGGDDTGNDTDSDGEEE